MVAITIDAMPRHRRLARVQAGLRRLLVVLLAAGVIVLASDAVLPLNPYAINPPDQPEKPSVGRVLTGNGATLTFGGKVAVE
jgi:hypothetical protein